MLKLTVSPRELYDPETESFIQCPGATLTLEHSLVSLSKWESKWKVPFLNNKDMTYEQSIDYIRCMTLTQNVNPNVYLALTQDDIKTIFSYIEDPMTATTIREIPGQGPPGRGRNKIVTSEVIYYWMTALNIPFECQKWHLNRLLMLIRVASIEQQPPKKMGKREAMAQQRSLNAARRAKYGTRG